MELGAFSISLAVKNIEASRRFCEHFGFKAFAGDASQKNILTFNPGWDSNAERMHWGCPYWWPPSSHHSCLHAGAGCSRRRSAVRQAAALEHQS